MPAPFRNPKSRRRPARKSHQTGNQPSPAEPDRDKKILTPAPPGGIGAPSRSSAPVKSSLNANGHLRGRVQWSRTDALIQQRVHRLRRLLHFNGRIKRPAPPEPVPSARRR